MFNLGPAAVCQHSQAVHISLICTWGCSRALSSPDGSYKLKRAVHLAMNHIPDHLHNSNRWVAPIGSVVQSYGALSVA